MTASPRDACLFCCAEADSGRGALGATLGATLGAILGVSDVSLASGGGETAAGDSGGELFNHQ